MSRKQVKCCSVQPDCSLVNCNIFQINPVQIGFSTLIFTKERIAGKLIHAFSTPPWSSCCVCSVAAPMMCHSFCALTQDIEETMNTALNELRELERQSSAKHAPDVVLDTLEQMKNSPTPATSTESLSPLHSVVLRSSEPQIRRSTSSSSDTMSTFKPMVAPRMGVQLKPPALRPKPIVLPKTNPSIGPSPPSQGPADKSCTM